MVCITFTTGICFTLSCNRLNDTVILDLKYFVFSLLVFIFKAKILVEMVTWCVRGFIKIFSQVDEKYFLRGVSYSMRRKVEVF